ncbi:MAG: undecaprenyl/decaprenyl-phosphate alpha-N-acetylglucosaminyl 1-phosphate transferase [Flavobacteriales bacterium]|nr:undecaprenyl/decaprenyl-phosphate alpha-N-acetylglucosaminyl 1-phosphate transferase [Flavobacteriales bacterium]
MYTILLGFATSFVIVLLSLPALIQIAFLKRLVDEPDDIRKTHKRRIPTIGGILIFAGTLFAYFLWYPFEIIHEFDHLYGAIRDFKYIGASMLILFFIGVKDDIIGTAAVKKLAGHLIVAFILVIMAEIQITSLHGLFGIYELDQWASIFLSVFTYTVIVNAFNLVDGVDGLAAGVGAIACIAYAIWFYYAGGIENASLAMALAGSLMGFLFFNFYPAKIFMGDAGPLIIGLIISVLSIKLIEFDPSELPEEMLHISKPVFAMACIAYPLVDTLRIFTYRVVRGISPFAPDRNHIHHRLNDLGLNHGWVAIVPYIYTMLITSIPIFLSEHEASTQLVVTGVVAILIAQIPIALVATKNRKK